MCDVFIVAANSNFIDKAKGRKNLPAEEKYGFKAKSVEHNGKRLLTVSKESIISAEITKLKTVYVYEYFWREFIVPSV